MYASAVFVCVYVRHHWFVTLTRHERQNYNNGLLYIRRKLNQIQNASTVFMITFHVPRHDDVIKWKLVPRYWPYVRGIHRSSVNSSHKSQRRGALMFSLICA